MTKYRVTWQETHSADVEVDHMEDAENKAMQLDDNKTLINIYGTTTTKIKEANK